MWPRDAKRGARAKRPWSAFPAEQQLWAWWAAELRAGRPEGYEYGLLGGCHECRGFGPGGEQV
jgi:hypothetical protein